MPRPLTTILQIRLGAFRKVTEDPLGRASVGAYPGMTPESAWKTAHGMWRLDATRVLDQEEVVVTDPDGLILATAVILAVRKMGSRHLIEGTLNPTDPRIGTITPSPNPGRNSIFYR